ncbi:hypothetical protein D9611_009200 [Ephemerocybe angulata]|uniref:C3H1-type domain-containing protein n=1 Tax=Ephemerocybe angulata TaxID=980116 RepID=A0A8H5CDI2_9AGAR|nr:hypothetical protein D9611_009200 [Tulosesus angulatus]
MTESLNISQFIMNSKSTLENNHDISSDSEDGYEPPFLQTITKEELRLARVQKRAQKKAEKHAKAEVFKRMGDELFHKDKFEEAYIPYLEATQIWPSNVDYYNRLSMTYSRLGWYEEAAHASTRALTLNPKSIEARYLRGVARLEQRLLGAAKSGTHILHPPTHLTLITFPSNPHYTALPRIGSYQCTIKDLEIVTTHDANHTKAADTLQVVLKSLEAGTKLGNHTISHETAPLDAETAAATAAIPELDFSYPHYDDEALEMDTLSNTSDCNHRGNGVPCRFYNRAGCAKGSLCPFSHAPDEKSVRDDLGRNVCTYFLLDTCKFGAAKCVYSHSRSFLPKHGWWTSEEATAKVKSIVELSERTMKERRSLAAQLSLLEKRARSKAARAKTPKVANEGDVEEAKEEGEVKESSQDGKAEEADKGQRKPGRKHLRTKRPQKKDAKDSSGPSKEKENGGSESVAALTDKLAGLTTEYKKLDGENRAEADPDASVVLEY